MVIYAMITGHLLVEFTADPTDGDLAGAYLLYQNAEVHRPGPHLWRRQSTRVHTRGLGTVKHVRMSS